MKAPRRLYNILLQRGPMTPAALISLTGLKRSTVTAALRRGAQGDDCLFVSEHGAYAARADIHGEPLFGASITEEELLIIKAVRVANKSRPAHPATENDR